MTIPSRVHDLTATLRTHMSVWASSPLPTFEPIGIVARDGYSIERVNCLTHTGTHVDAPYHFLEDGITIDRIPPDDLVGSAAVLDLRKDLSGDLIPRSLVESHWPKGPRPEIVLLETGWSHRRAPTKEYLYSFPGLEPEAAEWIAKQGVKGVGTDTLGIDPFSNARFEAHKVLLRKGIWLLEALDHLDQLEEQKRYTLVAAPLKIEGASGAMARVFAWESPGSGATTDDRAARPRSGSPPARAGTRRGSRSGG
jgi:arylformamidase